MSKENFEKAMKFVFEMEGGYSNRKDDRGGKTNMGVTQKNYDALSALSVLKHRIDLIYADFNLNTDTEKLKDDLKLISSNADKIIEDI